MCPRGALCGPVTSAGCRFCRRRDEAPEHEQTGAACVVAPILDHIPQGRILLRLTRLPKLCNQPPPHNETPSDQLPHGNHMRSIRSQTV